MSPPSRCSFILEIQLQSFVWKKALHLEKGNGYLRRLLRTDEEEKAYRGSCKDLEDSVSAVSLLGGSCFCGGPNVPKNGLSTCRLFV